MALSAEEREDEAENDADDDTGDEREIKRGVSALNPDIARQAAQPTGAEPAPQKSAEQDDHYPDDNEKFSDLWHRFHFARASAGGRRNARLTPAGRTQIYLHWLRTLTVR